MHQPSTFVSFTGALCPLLRTLHVEKLAPVTGSRGRHLLAKDSEG